MVRHALTLCGCLLIGRAGYRRSIVVDEADPRPTPQTLGRVAEQVAAK